MTGIVVGRIAACLLVGIVLGTGFFAMLRLNVRLYGSRRWPLAILVHLARWSLLVVALILLARAGATPLLSAAMGLLVARGAVMRWSGEASR
jgi:F1F0 ATPase subunit 2